MLERMFGGSSRFVWHALIVEVGASIQSKGPLAMRDDLPAWRSLLFVPITTTKFVDTCADRGADGIILDLEDAVAPSEKEDRKSVV